GDEPREVDETRSALLRRDDVAEEARRRHLAGASQRPEREGGSHEKPEGSGDDERLGVEADTRRDRKLRREEMRQAERRQPADKEADEDAPGGQRHDLRKVEAKDEPGRRADAF